LLPRLAGACSVGARRPQYETIDEDATQRTQRLRSGEASLAEEKAAASRRTPRFWPAEYVVRNRDSGISVSFLYSKDAGGLTGEIKGLSPGKGLPN